MLDAATMEAIPPPQTFVTSSTRVVCDGEDEDVAGHPRVWLQMGESGYADCGYCDRRFILAGGPADPR